MKKILILLLLLPILSFAQTKKEIVALYDKLEKKGTKDFSFNFIDTISYKTKSDFFLLTKVYFTEKFPYATDIIQLEDKEIGIIIVRSSFDWVYKPTYPSFDKIRITYYYLMKIECREGRYRMDMYDIIYTLSDAKGEFPPSKEYKLTDITNTYKNVFESKEKKNKERSIKTIRDKELDDLRRHSNLVYNILKGVDENVDKVFLDINKFVIDQVVKEQKEQW